MGPASSPGHAHRLSEGGQTSRVCLAERLECVRPARMTTGLSCAGSGTLRAA